MSDSVSVAELAAKHRHGPVVPRHRELDVADPLAGAEAAAGGRERCQEQRDRDRRAAAQAHRLSRLGTEGIAQADRDLARGDVLAVAGDQLGRFGQVTVAWPSASVGAAAPVTVAPATGLLLPFFVVGEDGAP